MTAACHVLRKSSRKLEWQSSSSIEVQNQTDRVTVLPRPLSHTRWTLSSNLDLWPWLSIPGDQRKKLKAQRSLGSKDRVFTNGRTLPTAVPSRLTRSVTKLVSYYSAIFLASSLLWWYIYIFIDVYRIATSSRLASLLAHSNTRPLSSMQMLRPQTPSSLPCASPVTLRLVP